MPEIIVAFNRTDNRAYVNYAKLSYEVRYADDPQTLRTIATVDVRFYIRPDSYTYTYFTSDRLYLGLRRGSAGAALEKRNVESLTNRNNVYSAVYNLVGAASFTVDYDGTSAYPLYLAAGYENDHTKRFSPFVMPQSDGGGYYQYIYESGGSNQIMLEKRFSYTPCRAPAVHLGPSPFEGALTLSWQGADGGVSNPVTGYELQWCESGDGVSFGGWTGLGTAPVGVSSFPAPVEIGRGRYLKCRVRAKGAAGDAFASSWAETGAARKNSAPGAPPALGVSPGVYGEGDRLDLSWPGAWDPDGPPARYVLEARAGNGAWAQVGVYTGTAATLVPTGAEDGESLYYRVRAEDSFGVPGPWRESGPVLRDDPTGVAVCKNGVYQKAYVYVCKNGVWVKGKLRVCKNGSYGT